MYIQYTRSICIFNTCVCVCVCVCVIHTRKHTQIHKLSLSHTGVITTLLRVAAMHASKQESGDIHVSSSSSYAMHASKQESGAQHRHIDS